MDSVPGRFGTSFLSVPHKKQELLYREFNILEVEKISKF
jgi:hypothetical protein